MHKQFIFFILFFGNFFAQTTPIFAQATTAADSVKKLPLLQTDRVSKNDVKHIALNLQFDWQKKQAFGTATIKMALIEKSDKLTLDAGMLSINSIKLANGKLLKFEYDGKDKDGGLQIKLDKIYDANEDIDLIIDYHTNWLNLSDPNSLSGSNGKGIRFFEPTFTEPRKRKQIWSMADYQSNRYWFPCNDVLSDWHTSEFIARVPENLTVISNGNLQKTTKNADKMQTFYWKMDTPYPNYQTAFVVGEYDDFQQNINNTQLHNYGYKDEKDGVKASVNRLPDMVKFFSKLTGAKYPQASYSQVFVQDLTWGMESAGFSTQTENMIDDEGTHRDFLYLWDGLEGEALARQWFGTCISAKNWSDIWLNKSFAHYLDGRYTEYKNGRAEYLTYYLPYDLNGLYLGDWASGLRHPIVTTHYENAADFVNDVITCVPVNKCTNKSPQHFSLLQSKTLCKDL